MTQSGHDPRPQPERRKRPKLTPLSGEMKRISALLEEELLEWPDVTARAMFGLRAFYRGAVIFAMLPQKRALESPNAIAYKLAADGREQGKNWRLFELEDGRDIRKALALLERAYTRAAGPHSYPASG